MPSPVLGPTNFSNGTGAQNSYTFSNLINCTSGEPVIIALGVCIDPGTTTISSITLGGQVMTLVINERSAGCLTNVVIAKLIGHSLSGNQTLVLTATGPDMYGMSGMYLTFGSGNDIVVSASTNGSGTSQQVTLTSVPANSYGIGIVCTQFSANEAAAAGSGWTVNDIANAFVLHIAETMADTGASGNKTVDFVGNDLAFAIAGAAINAVGGGGPTTKVMSDTMTVADSMVEWRRLPRVPQDLLTLSESFLDIVRFTRVGSDTTILSDGDRLKTIIVNREDALDLTDGIASWRRLRRVMDESLPLVDSFIKSISGSGGIVYTKVMSEAIEFSDGFVRWLRYRRVTSDTVDVLDAFSKIIAGAGITYAKIMSDSITLADDVGNRWKFVRTRTSDTLTLADSPIYGAIRGRLSADVIAVTDALTKWMRLIRQVGDDVQFSDGTVIVRRMLRTFSEQLDITDDLMRTLFLDQLQPTNFLFGTGADPFYFGIGRVL